MLACCCGVASLLVLVLLIISSDGGFSSSVHHSSKFFTLTATHSHHHADEKSDGRRDRTHMPNWISDYMKWHRSMRAKYPNEELITNPEAPKFLIRVCNGRCGGLHDRLGQLPLDLYLAQQSNRLLLIEWQYPHALEEFLVPPNYDDDVDTNTDEHHDYMYIDWRYPGQLIDRKVDKRKWPDIVNTGKMRNKDGVDDFDAFIGESIDRLNTGDLKDKRNVTYTVVQEYRKDPMLERFKTLDEDDAIYGTTSYGRIFNAFFKPSPQLQVLLDELYRDLNLVPREYSAVHCRVRHPFAHKRGTKIETGKFVANSDYQNFDFEGVFKESAVTTASHALKCASGTDDLVSKQPIYFMSDYSLLVNYMAKDVSTVNLVQEAANVTGYEIEAAKIASGLHVVSRPISGITYHIDKQNARGVGAYYGTFLDLYLGINARCLALGIGNYAAFAAEISGTDCVIRYAREKWGLGVTRGTGNFMCSRYRSIFDEGFS